MVTNMFRFCFINTKLRCSIATVIVEQMLYQFKSCFSFLSARVLPVVVCGYGPRLGAMVRS